jgi:flagellin
MTRINTNVSSLIAQKTLAKSYAEEETSLTRLSTGLKINSGADDPAGLIAASSLSSTINSINKALANTETANEMIATADSGLSQVSSLLEEIRGLITSAANTATLTDEQIEADQLVIDSSLDAINRIASSVSFNGKNLLDGSLAFTTHAGNNTSTIADMDIYQATLDSNNQMNVNVDITAAATKATMTNSAQTLNNATASLDFGSGFHFGTSTANTGLEIIALDNNVQIEVQYADYTVDNALASYCSSNNVLTLTISNNAATTVGTLVDEVNTNGSSVVLAYSEANNTTAAYATSDVDFTAMPMIDSTLDITACNTSAQFNNMTVSFVTYTTATTDATYNASNNTLIITVNNAANATPMLSDIVAEIEAITDNNGTQLFGTSLSHLLGSPGGRQCLLGNNTTDTGHTAKTGLNGNAVLQDSLVLQITGKLGSSTFNFDAGTTMAQVAQAIDLLSDSTGVEATTNNTTGALELISTTYGSAAVIDVKVISEGANGTFQSGLNNTTRVTGTDIEGSINGYKAKGTANTLTLNTASLAMSLTVDEGSSTDLDFSITGGGAVFQLGSEVTSSQQARLGLTSVNTGALGGASGRLYLLGSGQNAALDTDTTLAAAICDEVMTKVTSLRGRLGAFQSTTLDSNSATLNDTVENLTNALSTTQDTDYAEESANLTRAQILVQSGISVLSITNSAPQAVLSLLQQ